MAGRQKKTIPRWFAPVSCKLSNSYPFHPVAVFWIWAVVTGDIAIWLGLEGYEAYGMDIAPSAIAWAKEKAQAQQSQVQFTVGSVLDLAAYPDNFFHLVVDGRCLHCIIGPDRAATLASVYRVLQPGGGFLVQSMCGEVMGESLHEGQL